MTQQLPTKEQAAQLIQGKQEPHDTSLEQAVLGALMIDKNAIHQVAKTLLPEDFYEARHTIILGAILRLYDRGDGIDLLTVLHECQEEPSSRVKIEPHYLAQLTNQVASAAHLGEHVSILKALAIKREAIKLGVGLIERGYDPKEAASKVLDYLSGALLKMTRGAQKKGASSMMEITIARQQELDIVASKAEGDVLGIPTGYPALDRLIQGLQAPDLIVLAARPGMGKTSLSLNMARNISKRSIKQKAGLIFSLEMSGAQLNDRLVCMEAHVTLHKVRDPREQSPDEKKRVAAARSDVADMKIWVDDTPGISIREVRAKAMELKYSHDIDYLIVDYLQLMTAPEYHSHNREAEVSYISRTLKALAKELHVPIIALSQLSRAVETRGGSGRPKLSDLRESGAIEQDADIVGFIYRPEVYGITQDEDEQSTSGLAEIIIAKNRHGGPDTVHLRWVPYISSFMNWSGAHDDEEDLSQVFKPQGEKEEELPF